MHAIAYVRVSGLAQVDGDGPERQRKAIDARAALLGLQVLRQFDDLGVSGTKGHEERPGLTAALEAAAEVGAVLLVEKADRLARDIVVSELALRSARRLGVRVVEAENGTDLTNEDSPTGAMLRQILGAVSAYERAALVAKMRAAKDRIRRETGRACEGQKAFGHRAGEAETLAVARTLVASGLTWEAAAAELNRQGRKPRRGAGWTRGSLHRVLGGIREPVA
jgi:DNA invertase Pin-like site-specific DNA recombinase